MIACRQVFPAGFFVGAEEGPVTSVCNKYGAALLSQECRFIKVQKTREQQPHLKGAQNAGRVHGSRMEREEGYRPAGRVWLLGRNEFRQVPPELKGSIRKLGRVRFALHRAF